MDANQQLIGMAVGIVCIPSVIIALITLVATGRMEKAVKAGVITGLIMILIGFVMILLSL